MNNIIKGYITWSIGMIFFPIGLYWIQEFNHPILNIFSFLISGIIIILTLNYLIKSISEVD